MPSFEPTPEQLLPSARQASYFEANADRPDTSLAYDYQAVRGDNRLIIGVFFGLPSLVALSGLLGLLAGVAPELSEGLATGGAGTVGFLAVLFAACCGAEQVGYRKGIARGRERDLVRSSRPHAMPGEHVNWATRVRALDGCVHVELCRFEPVGPYAMDWNDEYHSGRRSYSAGTDLFYRIDVVASESFDAEADTTAIAEARVAFDALAEQAEARSVTALAHAEDEGLRLAAARSERQQRAQLTAGAFAA